jgi:carboxyl-terminal processing protease
MIPFSKKNISSPLLLPFLFVGASFKTTFEIAKQIEIFTTFQRIKHQLCRRNKPGELMDKAIKGMLSSLDPYTVYFQRAGSRKFYKQYRRVYWNRGFDYQKGR